MPRFLPDSSTMVAALCAWHEHHSRATAELERRLNAGQRLVSAAPALVETYSVLTRLPPPRRLSPATARTLLESNFMGETVDVIALNAEGYHHLIDTAPNDGIGGGRIYNAVIAACATSGGVDVLLTFNEHDFLSLGPAGDRDRRACLRQADHTRESSGCQIQRQARPL